MLENYPYCPILHARIAEIKALAQLPSATKDRIFPLIVARPWANARQLNRTWEKISDAIGNRRFGLDLDRTRYGRESDRPAQSEFDDLFDRRGGYANYYDAVRQIDQALPVLRVEDDGPARFSVQAGHIDDIERGVIVRLQYGAVNNPIAVARQVIDRFDDISFFIDVGWSRDIIGREFWASGIISAIVEMRPETEIVVSGSSFPDSFAGIGERGEFRVDERFLFSDLVRQHNAAVLIYGDWGSTRPPTTESVPMRNIPRIDLPTASNWLSFRRDPDLEDEDYEEIARRVVNDPEWRNVPDIWGAFTIDWTANGEPGAIRSPATAAAARINIHLHKQALFGAGEVIVDGDEPFTDD